MRVETTVDTVDEALTWIVRQIDRRAFERPHVQIQPMFSYPLGDEEGGRWRFLVSIGAEVDDSVEVTEP